MERALGCPANQRGDLRAAACALAVVLAGARLTAVAQPGSGQASDNAIGSAPTASEPDVIELRTGQRISGRILNPQFTLRTSYGELIVKTSYLKRIESLENEHNLQTLFTVNSNRLLGFIEETAFKLQRPDQSLIEVPNPQLARAIFGRRPLPEPPNAGALWVRLRTDDLMSGRFLAQPLSLNAGATNVEVDLNEVISGSFGANSDAELTAELQGGKPQRGRPATPYIEFQLDAGPSVKLYAGSVSWLGTAAKRAELIPGDLPASSADRAAQSAGPAMTNLIGFVWIPAGRFHMGSPTDEMGRDPDEGPQTQVTISRGFWMCAHEVTQAEFRRVMGNNPSNTTGDTTRPVERVTWFEANDYCKKLTDEAEHEGRLPESYTYRLPTEAEWEYACRAGTDTRFSFGDDKNALELPDYAWFTRNSDSAPHPVRTRKPNAWGLYDMHGNVWEWCLDRWEDGLPGGAVTNRIARASGSLRVARGGSWLYEPKACRSANRDDYSPWNRCSDVGFRVVLGPVQ